ncbi:MAG: hypothetical protein GOMPHAMPRED_007335 [Gomphillus americanus]|uniref:Lysozyme n=1 Tax=Gomphillus americanus TaxID=1940652 RepID=A0A8H3EPS9_9LECA|nr:MAG: hypothetical protein GOMPHAMPRED_007335 [Gomphillus americanus]
MKVSTILPIVALSAGIADASKVMVRSTAAPVNAGALALIEKLEGFRANYYTINGDQTIGFGHDCTQRKDCANIHPPITRQQGVALLQSDLPGYEGCVCSLPNSGGLNANQYGALVSFTYNSGCGNTQKFFKSYMQSSNYNGICQALPTTNTLNGQLNSRRQQEGAFCGQATNQPSGCGGSGTGPGGPKPSPTPKPTPKAQPN